MKKRKKMAKKERKLPGFEVTGALGADLGESAAPPPCLLSLCFFFSSIQFGFSPPPGPPLLPWCVAGLPCLGDASPLELPAEVGGVAGGKPKKLRRVF